MLDHTKPYVEKIHYIDAELAGHVYGALFIKILYATDLPQKLLYLRTFSYLCAHLAISGHI